VLYQAELHPEFRREPRGSPLAIDEDGGPRSLLNAPARFNAGSAVRRPGARAAAFSLLPSVYAPVFCSTT
jgi:hypothetical protein